MEQGAVSQTKEVKNLNLQEIFLFYCRQHIMIGRHKTFDDIKKEVRNMSLGDFIKFTSDFSIQLSKQQLMLIYKKTAVYSREMYFSQFKQSLINLQREINNNFISKDKTEIQHIQEAIKLATEPQKEKL